MYVLDSWISPFLFWIITWKHTPYHTYHITSQFFFFLCLSHDIHMLLYKHCHVMHTIRLTDNNLGWYELPLYILHTPHTHRMHMHHHLQSFNSRSFFYSDEAKATNSLYMCVLYNVYEYVWCLCVGSSQVYHHWWYSSNQRWMIISII